MHVENQLCAHCDSISTYQTPHERNGCPSAETVGHFKRVMATGPSLWICEDNHPDQECEDNIREH